MNETYKMLTKEDIEQGMLSIIKRVEKMDISIIRTKNDGALINVSLEVSPEPWFPKGFEDKVIFCKCFHCGNVTITQHMELVDYRDGKDTKKVALCENCHRLHLNEKKTK